MGRHGRRGCRCIRRGRCGSGSWLGINRGWLKIKAGVEEGVGVEVGASWELGAHVEEGAAGVEVGAGWELGVGEEEGAGAQ